MRCHVGPMTCMRRQHTPMQVFNRFVSMAPAVKVGHAPICEPIYSAASSADDEAGQCSWPCGSSATCLVARCCGAITYNAATSVCEEPSTSAAPRSWATTCPSAPLRSSKPLTSAAPRSRERGSWRRTRDQSGPPQPRRPLMDQSSAWLNIAGGHVVCIWRALGGSRLQGAQPREVQDGRV